MYLPGLNMAISQIQWCVKTIASDVLLTCRTRVMYKVKVLITYIHQTVP